MSNHRNMPEKNAPDPILPEPVGEDGLVQPNDEPGWMETDDDGLGPADEDEDQPGLPDRMPMHGRDDETSAVGGRLMSEDEKLDEALEETFPTSDPIAPGRIDGPDN